MTLGYRRSREAGIPLETKMTAAFTRMLTFCRRDKNCHSFFSHKWVFRSTQANDQPDAQPSVFSYITLSAPIWGLLTGKRFDMDKVMK